MLKEIKAAVESHPAVKACLGVNENSMFGPRVFEIELKVHGEAAPVRIEFSEYMEDKFPGLKFNYVYFTTIPRA